MASASEVSSEDLDDRLYPPGAEAEEFLLHGDASQELVDFERASASATPVRVVVGHDPSSSRQQTGVVKEAVPSLKARMDALLAGLKQASGELVPHAELVSKLSSATFNLVSDLYNLTLVEENEALRMGVAKAMEDGNALMEGLGEVSDGLTKVSGLQDDVLAAGVVASEAVGTGAGAAPSASDVQRLEAELRAAVEAHQATSARAAAAEAELAALSEACLSLVGEVNEARSMGAGPELLAGIAERLQSAASRGVRPGAYTAAAAAGTPGANRTTPAVDGSAGAGADADARYRSLLASRTLDHAVSDAALASLTAQLTVLQEERHAHVLASKSMQHAKSWMAKEIQALQRSLAEAEAGLSEAEARLAVKDQKLKDAVGDFRRIKDDMIGRLQEKDRMLADARREVAEAREQGADDVEALMTQLRAAQAAVAALREQQRSTPPPPEPRALSGGWDGGGARGAGAALPQPRLSPPSVRRTAGSPGLIGSLLPDSQLITRLADGAMRGAVAELRAESGGCSGGDGGAGPVGQPGVPGADAGHADSIEAAWAELERAKRAHRESLRVVQAMHEEAQRFNRNLWIENAKLIARAEALQAQLLQLVASNVSERMSASSGVAAAAAQGASDDRGGSSAAAAASESDRDALAESQEQVQALQRTLLERNAVIAQLSEELVEVSNDVRYFEETVLRCEAVTAQLQAHRSSGAA